MKTTTLLATLLAVCASIGLAQGPRKTTLDKAAIESYLRRLEMWNPQVQVAIEDPVANPYAAGYSELTVHLSYNGQSIDQRYFISADGQHLFKGEAFDLTRSPFQSNIDKISLDKTPSFGATGGTINLVVFGDFQCPYCKAEAEVLRKNLTTAFPDTVRVFFKDYPLESIHPWARAGAIAGRCVYNQSSNRFWDFHDWIYSIQGDVTEANLRDKVLAWAGEAKLDVASLGNCMDTKASEADVNNNIAEARKLGINATPTLFLNGNKFEGTLEWPVLQQLIKFELDYQANGGVKPPANPAAN